MSKTPLALGATPENQRRFSPFVAFLRAGAFGVALVAAAFATPFFAVLWAGAFFAKVFFVDDG